MMILREAKLLDLILKTAESNPPFARLSESEEYDSYDFSAAGKLLKQYEFGAQIIRGDFQVYSSGISFIRGDSFVKRFKEESERQRKKDLLTDKTIKAAKQEPFWKWATFFLGVLTIIFAYLQFKK